LHNTWLQLFQITTMLKHKHPLCVHLLLYLVTILTHSSSTASGFGIIKDLRPLTWTGSSFSLQYESAESIFESSSRYVSKSAIATRVQIYRDDAIVALPRFRPGVPITFARTSLQRKNSQSTFSAFPFWGLREKGNCQTVQAVVDVFLDANDTVWVLDAGIVNTLEQSIRRCPPKIMCLCPKTGKVLNVIELCSLVSRASRL
jgi:hypothetical protein